MKENKEFYRRNLPHWQPIGGLFFVTYSLFGSIPRKKMLIIQNEYESLQKVREKEEISAYKIKTQARKKYLARIDELLNDSQNKGPQWMKKEEISEIMEETLHFWDKKSLDLYGYCIMSNHVHVVFELFDKKNQDNKQLFEILHSIKRYSAVEANKILKRSGKFWMNESWDYLIRNEQELIRILEYVLDNPIKAGLCKKRKDWKWSYVKEEYNYLLEC